MKTINIIFLLSIFLIGICCSKDDPNPDENDLSGSIVFFTNAQAILNCGPFKVDLYIDSSLIGSINRPYLATYLGDCYQSDSTLLIEKKVGTYSYFAEANCGKYGFWDGHIEIKSDSCKNIFLDINNIHYNESEIKMKLVGTWIEQMPCDSCNTFQFSDNDSIIQINNLSGEKLPATYQIISDDSIMVTRLWEIEQNKKTTSHEIIFHSSDTLEILQFLPVDFGLTGFENVKLYKSK
jgi:hypothetical protein